MINNNNQTDDIHSLQIRRNNIIIHMRVLINFIRQQ